MVTGSFLVAGAGSDTSYRKTVERKKNVQGRGGEGRTRLANRVARSPSGRATDDDKNGGIFTATNKYSLLPFFVFLCIRIHKMFLQFIDSI